MNRAQKVEYVAALTQRIQEAPLVMLTDYRGVQVNEITRFREHLRQRGMRYEVVKNTLARLAVKDTQHEALADHLTGMTGWIFSGEDPIAAAKAVREVTKELDFKKKERFSIKGGFFEGEALTGEQVEKVADLPSKEELLSTLLRTLQEGPRQVMGVIQGPARDLLYVLKNYERKLAELGDADL